MPDSIVLCIPGPWEDQRAFLAELVTRGKGLAAGMILTSIETKASCMFQFEEANPRLEWSFGVSLMPDDTLPAIGAHRSVIYLIEPKERGMDAVRRMIDLSVLCLKAGGLGVKVEAAGKAFSAETWLRLSESPLSAYEQMVLHLVTSEEGYYSCGMHQFGYPDTLVETDDFAEALEVARTLERYQIYEEPEIASGHTFGTAEGAQVWRLTRADHPYHGDEILDRSLGVWRLSKAA